MYTHYKHIRIFVLLWLIGFFTQGQAQYAIRNSVFSNGGQTLTDSVNYKLYNTTGQTLIGETGNSNNIGKVGFWYVSSDLLTALENPFDNLPHKFELYQNYPNPFNPATTIKFALPKSTDVKIIVYNLLGQKVLTLMDEKRNAGYHTIQLNGNNLASGMYFYTIEADYFHAVKKMLLVK